MKELNGDTKFFVDVQHGSHYHVAGCHVLSWWPPTCYVELPYSEIRELRNKRNGGAFVAHGCVVDAVVLHSMDTGTVPCRICGIQIPTTSTKLCNRCWELETRIKDDPELAAGILSRIGKLRIVYRGWPGHFIMGNRCVFHLNTLIEYMGIRIVVSTVGNLQSNPLKSRKPEEVGAGRYYETMAFHARFDDGYWDTDTDTSKMISLQGKTAVTKMTWESDAEAQEMHEVAVQETVRGVREGRIRNE